MLNQIILAGVVGEEGAHIHRCTARQVVGPQRPVRASVLMRCILGQ